MGSTIVSLTLALAASAASGPGYEVTTGHGGSHAYAYQRIHQPGGRIVLDGPGNGWGFPNGNPDGYGFVDFGDALPLGANRIAEYYFPRFLAVPATQAFLPSYYNPYLTRGQRYIAFVGCGGAHPAGGPPVGSAETPVHPYQESIGRGPQVNVPPFTGRIEAPPINSGGSGLTP